MGYRRAGWLSLPAKLSQQSRLSSRYVAASKGTSQHHHSCADWQSLPAAVSQTVIGAHPTRCRQRKLVYRCLMTRHPQAPKTSGNKQVSTCRLCLKAQLPHAFLCTLLQQLPLCNALGTC